MATITESKKELRALVKSRVALLTPAQMDEQSRQIFRQIERLDAFRNATHVLAYWSMPKEVNTHWAVERWARVKNVYLPVIWDNALVLVRFDGRERMVRNAQLPVYEPQGPVFGDLDKITLAIVPGLAFDAQGHRLGKGGGFYDKLLPSLTNAYTIGVAFAQQMVPQVPVETHDWPLREVVMG